LPFPSGSGCFHKFFSFAKFAKRAQWSMMCSVV
jgi:hypothetical protein